MDKLTQRIKEALIRNILNTKMDNLDTHYMTTSQGSYTRRELAKEIEEETEVGMRELQSLFGLTLYLVEKGKQTI